MIIYETKPHEIQFVHEKPAFPKKKKFKKFINLRQYIHEKALKMAFQQIYKRQNKVDMTIQGTILFQNQDEKFGRNIFGGTIFSVVSHLVSRLKNRLSS